MNDPRIPILRDAIAGIQAQCAMLLGVLSQMQGPPQGASGTPDAVRAIQERLSRKPQHYGEAPATPANPESVGAETPSTAPAGATTAED